MKRLKPIQVYEHSLLRKEGNLTDTQWKALGEYNQAYGSRFFTLQTNGIKFNQYVGVIQAGNLTIEVLPKIDKREAETEKGVWHGVLLDMLRQCHWMDQQAHQSAPLRLKHRSILEPYLELFLDHCTTLLHKGLAKRYRQEEGNKSALKGKLLFAENTRYNAFHAERVYTRHRVYDAQHTLNQILLKAIRLVPRLSTHSSLKDKVGRLLLAFPELPSVAVDKSTFERIHYDRKTAHYEPAINIAAMLLLHYRPDIRGGNQHVLAILFNMNELWEEYVYRQLRKVSDYTVLPQRRKRFWQPKEGTGFKVIKPDLLIASKETNSTVIIDTKWKTPDGNKPGDDDLKQMFAYNEYWKSDHAVLLYPGKEKIHFAKGGFCKTGEPDRHGCSMLRLSVLNSEGKGLDKDFGIRLFKNLEGEGIL